MSGPWDDYGAQPSSDGPWSAYGPAPKADPQIGNPQDLTFAEKYVAPLLEKVGLAGNLRGSAIGGMMQGAADPGVKLVQLAANVVGQGDAVNKAIQNEEQQYQQARSEAGRSGMDLSRVAGNAVITAPLGTIGGAPTTLMGLAGKGALQGAISGALQPVTNGGQNFWSDTAKDVGLGALTGAGTSVALGSLARVVSPNASVNPHLELLRSEGVQPTVGQALGGAANAAEEKLQSFPIVGDAVRSARGRALAQFNNAAINRTVAPIGQQVSGAGQDAVAEAGNLLSNAYESALSKVNHVNFDTPQFNAQFGQLQDMAQGLSPSLAQKFDQTVNNVVLRKMSPNGSILGSDLKAVDSELGQLARRYGKSVVASEQEFGDAVKQLQSIVRQQVASSNPEYAAAQAAADTGWANLVRVENAAKRAVNNEGVFTPGQLNMAARALDTSVRGRATARGTALMQDLGTAGQNVLGNRIPDSGTAGRALLIGAALSAPVSVPAGMAGAALYSRPVQNALLALVSQRPEAAPAVANYLRQIAGPASVVTPQLLQ